MQLKKLSSVIAVVILVPLILWAVAGAVTAFHDGPLGVVPGGPFSSGKTSPYPLNWNFLAGRNTLQFQTVEPPVARTIAFVVVDGRLFLTSNMQGINSWYKRWPYQAVSNSEILLRVDGQVYEARLFRIEQGLEIEPVLHAFESKYNDSMGIGAAEITEGYTWMFEVVDH